MQNYWLEVHSDDIVLCFKSEEIVDISLGINADYFLFKLKKSGLFFMDRGCVNVNVENDVVFLHMKNIVSVKFSVTELIEILKPHANTKSLRFYYGGDYRINDIFIRHGCIGLSVTKRDSEFMWGFFSDLTPEMVLDCVRSKTNAIRFQESGNETNSCGAMIHGKNIDFIFTDPELKPIRLNSEEKDRFIAWCSRFVNETRPS